MSARELILELNIPADEYLRYYQGAAGAVQARSRCGRTVRFPAGQLRRFVDENGVHGSFRLRYDQNNRLVSLERIKAGDY